jgi:type II secretory ATPase GspE/PulE/Tfp pilus assembly ATPase PilB-like protein
MPPQLRGYPQGLGPFKNLEGFFAKTQGLILITGPVGSGKKESSNSQNSQAQSN